MSRIIRTSILTVALAVLLAPAALAERPDDREGRISVGSVYTTGTTYAHPDDRAEARGPGALDTTPVLVRTQPSESDAGFDWGAAAVGATAAFGLALLLLGAAHIVGRDRRHVPA